MEPLGASELKRRIDAARTLRGFKQAELAKRLADDGHPAYHIGEVERGNMALTGTLRRSLAYHLQVAEAWFTEPDIDRLIGHPDTDTATLASAGLEDRLAAIEQALAGRTQHDATVDQLLEQQNELLARQSQILTRIEALLNEVRRPAQAESAGFEVPTVPQELRDALSSRPAARPRDAGSRRKRGSGGQGA